MFKKSKTILLVLISLAFISMFLYFIFTFIVKKNDVVLVNEIKEYNYICKSTATSLYKEKFNELSDILKEEVDYELYAKKIVELFVIDFYTLDNKDNKNDIGGLQYIYDDIKENFILNATNTIYKYLKTNIFGNRNQELPIVNKIISVESELTEYNEYEAYIINIKWDYLEDLQYESEGKFIVINKDNKLYIIEKE